MPRKTQSQSVKKQGDDAREPDDLKEGERMASVGRRGDEYEDIEESRARSSNRDASNDADEEELSDEDIVDEVDLDALAEGDGPDA